MCVGIAYIAYYIIRNVIRNVLLGTVLSLCSGNLEVFDSILHFSVFVFQNLALVAGKFDLLELRRSAGWRQSRRDAGR